MPQRFLSFISIAMNWMTSAKNRIKRSKTKREESMRMVASSKLPTATRRRDDLTLHSFQPIVGAAVRNESYIRSDISKDGSS
jgi:hypothetical protein